ncbi:MAG: peptide-methionine (S)-S-oxide reductase MsrA [Kordia sp.]|uniref:peptide-methionine (S)-S-oxide reductase MsrA n=1 Tax=Kordia sp. TaxID=1965332 RepID=UPI0038596E7D
MKSIYISLIAIAFFTLSCNSNTHSVKKSQFTEEQLSKYETAYFASGCFWCVEAIFESVKGVKEVVSGYAGGKAETANYQLVSAGRTDHAEAVKVYYDPKVVSYETLVKVFFVSHDPTTLNRQGPDAGRQYRSAIFYKNDSEKKTVDTYIAQLKKEQVFSGTITTEIAKYTAFYDAEDYHQDYELRNPNNPYIKGVSVPRLKRFQKKFPQLLKKDAH